MRKISLYITLLVTFLLTACQQEEMVQGTSDLKPGEYLFTVSISEPMEASRAWGVGDDLTQKPMRVLVFDKNGFFTAFCEATLMEQESDGSIKFKVSLPPSNEPCALHFVLGDVKYDKYTRGDSESSIFSKLSTSDGNDAYWQRVEVTSIKEGETLLPGPIELVRNFAKISLDVEEAATSRLKLVGYKVIDALDAGTVAPYAGRDENGGFADFNLSLAPGENAYDKFVSVNNGFDGRNNVGQLIEDNDFNSWNSEDKYVYERNQDKSDAPAFLLIKATYDNVETYYKLDIVTVDGNYITSYLNLYRNFHYKVHIKSVVGKGYSSPEEAMENAASNNLSASVEVSEVNDIEDGLGNELWVSDMNIMLVSSEPYTMTYKYIAEGNVANDQVIVTPVGGPDEGGYNKAAVREIKDNRDGTITITPAATTDLMQKQEFVISTPSLLSRKVTVYVRNPFIFSAVDCDEHVERKVNAEMTLVVRLPDNMPNAVFPLTLNMEPEDKTIYPNTSQNRIPVEAGDHTFSYKATVTYNDYRKNPTFFFHFKTNVAESATTITVTNPYFKNENNTATFDNVNVGDVFDFGKVTLNGFENLYTCSSQQNKGETLELQFDLHDPGDNVISPDEHTIEIFGDYLDWNNVQIMSESGGSYTVREDNHCILYVPKNVYERQTLVFTIAQDYASGTIQLSARDHTTATIDYTTPPVTVTLQYTDGYVRNTNIDIYKGSDDAENKITTKETNSSGQITMDTFVGLTGEDVVVFKCKIRSGKKVRTYMGQVTVSDLTSGDGVVFMSVSN